MNPQFDVMAPTTVAHPFCAHVIVCEFDLQAGALVRCIYPPLPFADTTVDDITSPEVLTGSQLIADYCLPDGAEVRNFDSTFFVLRRPEGFLWFENSAYAAPAVVSAPDVPPKSARLFKYTDLLGGWIPLHKDRDDVVAALEGFTLRVSAGDLPLFETPIGPHSGLKHERDCFFSFSHEGLRYGLELSADNELNLLLAAFKRVASQQPPDEVLYCLSVCHSYSNPDLPRGSMVKAVAVASHAPFLLCLRPFLQEYIRDALESSLDDDTIAQNCFQLLTQAELPSALPLYASRIRRVLTRHPDHRFQRLVLPHVGEVTVPLLLLPSEAVLSPVTQMLSLLADDFILVLNAMVLGCSVLIYSSQSAEIVSDFVLALAGLLGDVFPGLLEQRVFPYVTVHNQLYYAVQGCVVGATNALFLHRNKFFDVVVNLDEATVELATHIVPETAHLLSRSARHAPLDFQLIVTLLDGIKAQRSDEWFRHQIREHYSSILRISLGKQPGPKTQTAKLAADNFDRLERLRSSPYFSQWQGYHLCSIMSASQPLGRIGSAIISLDRSALHTLPGLVDELEEYFQGLSDDASRLAQSVELLYWLSPGSSGGLTSIAKLVYHPHHRIAHSVTKLFNLIAISELGASLVDVINPFFRFGIDLLSS